MGRLIVFDNFGNFGLRRCSKVIDVIVACKAAMDNFDDLGYPRCSEVIGVGNIENSLVWYCLDSSGCLASFGGFAWLLWFVRFGWVT